MQDVCELDGRLKSYAFGPRVIAMMGALAYALVEVARGGPPLAWLGTALATGVMPTSAILPRRLKARTLNPRCP